MEEGQKQAGGGSPARKKVAETGAWPTPGHSPSSRGGRIGRGTRTRGIVAGEEDIGQGQTVTMTEEDEEVSQDDDKRTVCL